MPDDAQLAGLQPERAAWPALLRARGTGPREPSRAAARGPKTRVLGSGPSRPCLCPPDALGWVWGVVSGAPSLPWLCWAGRPLGEVTGVSQLQGPLSAVGVAAFPGLAALGTEPPLCAGS